jgi:hypothetical protein
MVAGLAFELGHCSRAVKTKQSEPSFGIFRACGLETLLVRALKGVKY